jgi:hypothetical protein
MNRIPAFRTIASMAALSLALVAAGCGADEDPEASGDDTPAVTTTADPGTSGPAPSTAETPPEPTDQAITTVVEALAGIEADTVVLRLASGGGFVPMEIAMAEVPSLVVMGDGRVLRSLQSDEMPPAPIREIEELRLDEAGLAALLAAAEEAGLLGEGDPAYGDPPVTDLPTTSLTLTTADGTVTHSAYALGFDAGGNDGLTAEQRERRAALSAFIERLGDLETLAGDHLTPVGPYVPEQVVLERFAAPEGAGAQRVPWPVDVVDPPAEGCSELTGEDAAAVADALAKAGPDVSWTLSGVEFRVIGRAVLPGEEGCVR